MKLSKIDLHHLLAEEPFVRSLAERLVADDADDVVQQAYLRALESRPSSPINQPRAWLGRIVRNLVADAARRSQRRIAREQKATSCATAPSSTQLMESEEARRALIQAVDSLPSDQRAVVLLRYYDGLPPRRIATELSIPAVTVRKRLHAALETLRARLDLKNDRDRRAWLLPLVPFATSQRSLPWRETLSTTPALAVIAMTVKTKLVTTLAVTLALTVAWIAWPTNGSPAPDPRHTAPHDRDERASGTIPRALGNEESSAASKRETASTQPPVPTATTGALLVHVRYASEPVAAHNLTVIVGRPGGGNRAGTYRAVTDSKGAVHFDGLPPGKVRVMTNVRPTTSETPVIEAGTTTECTLTLDGGMTLAGVVVDSTGTPVGGAVVETAMPAFPGVDAAQVAVTSADGTFTVRECDSLTLVGARAQHLAASQLKLIQGKRNTVEHIRIELTTPGGSVQGLVVGLKGEPIADAVVRVGSGRTDQLNGLPVPLPAQVRTNASGQFTAIGVPTGEQPLMVRAGPFAPWRGICVVAASGTTSVRVELSAGMTCRGTVRNEDGEPVVATVTANSLDDFAVVHTETDRDGTFELVGLPAGEVTVKASRYPLGKSATRVHGVAGEIVSCELSLSNGIALRGRIVNPDGDPIPYVEVLREVEGGSADGTTRIHTTAEGRFLFADCPANTRFTIRVSARDYETLTQRDVDPGTGELELRMQRDTSPRAQIRGILLRPDGSGAVGEIVKATRRDPMELCSARVHEDGSFLIEVQDGSWSTIVAVPNHPRIVIGPRRLEPGATWNLATMTLTHGGTLVVRDGGGPELSYQILDNRERFVAAPYGSEQPLRSELLAPGDYQLLVRGEGVASQVLPFTIHPDREAKLEVRRPAGVRQRLEFVHATLGMLPNSIAFTVYRDGKPLVIDFARGSTDNKIAHAVWLPPGHYTLSTRDRKPTSTISFEVGRGEGDIVRVPLRE